MTSAVEDAIKKREDAKKKAARPKRKTADKTEAKTES